MAAIEELIAFVTGGNRGLGKEVCRQLLGHGFHVVLASRDVEKGLRSSPTGGFYRDGPPLPW
jgi:carbonyl reductase 1